MLLVFVLKQITAVSQVLLKKLNWSLRVSAYMSNIYSLKKLNKRKCFHDKTGTTFFYNLLRRTAPEGSF